jgi:hypothetical protein
MHTTNHATGFQSQNFIQNLIQTFMIATPFTNLLCSQKNPLPLEEVAPREGLLRRVVNFVAVVVDASIRWRFERTLADLEIPHPFFAHYSSSTYVDVSFSCWVFRLEWVADLFSGVESWK